MDGRSARNLEKSVCGVEEVGLWFMLIEYICEIY